MRKEPKVGWTKQDLLKVARRQRSLLWVVLVYIAGSLILTFLISAGMAEDIRGVVVLASGIVSACFTYRLAVAVRSSVPWLWAVLVFIPCGGLVVLIFLVRDASAILRSQGIRLGLMGARMSDFDKMV